MDAHSSIPCTRYAENGEEQPRVREALAYAVALSGGRLSAHHLFSLHDHKGELEAMWASNDDRAAFGPFIEEAWHHWACEPTVVHSVVDWTATALMRGGRTLFVTRAI